MTNSVIIFGGIGFISAEPPSFLLLHDGQINFEEGIEESALLLEGLYLPIFTCSQPLLCLGLSCFSTVTRYTWLSFRIIALSNLFCFEPPARPCKASKGCGINRILELFL